MNLCYHEWKKNHHECGRDFVSGVTWGFVLIATHREEEHREIAKRKKKFIMNIYGKIIFHGVDNIIHDHKNGVVMKKCFE